MSFPQIRTTAMEFPSTILGFLGIEVPDGLQPPNQELMNKFNAKAVVMIVIDNFGLFEAVVYKPEALIKNMEALAVIETDDPYAIPLINTLLHGPHQDFHLINYVKSYGKVIRVICREQDMSTFGFGPGYTVNPRDDMATYIESTKHIFKSELLYLLAIGLLQRHFSKRLFGALIIGLKSYFGKREMILFSSLLEIMVDIPSPLIMLVNLRSGGKLTLQ